MTGIGKFFGAKVIVSTYVEHDTIYISPKEEALFMKLIEWENSLDHSELKPRPPDPELMKQLPDEDD